MNKLRIIKEENIFVAQWTEQLLPTPEDLGSKPVIGNFLLPNVYSKDELHVTPEDLGSKLWQRSITVNFV